MTGIRHKRVVQKPMNGADQPASGSTCVWKRNCRTATVCICLSAAVVSVKAARVLPGCGFNRMVAESGADQSASISPGIQRETPPSTQSAADASFGIGNKIRMK